MNASGLLPCAAEESNTLPLVNLPMYNTDTVSPGIAAVPVPTVMSCACTCGVEDEFAVVVPCVEVVVFCEFEEGALEETFE